MTEYNIRLNPNCASVVNTGLKFKSGDKGITLVIAVDELDTTGTTAKIIFQRANGTSVESDITGTDGVFTYKTLGNEFAVPGKTVADVKFYAADTRVSTASFVFEVSADTMEGLGAGAGGYSDRLEQLVTEAEKAGELTEQARAELEEAESDMKETEAEMAAVLQKFKEQYGEVGALNPRGNWNNATNYQIRDTVYHNSSTWICLVDNVGVEPSDANKKYWMRSTDLQSIINGTTPAGNALKLNGLTAEEFVKGNASFFYEGETILGWALNPNGEYIKMVAGNYRPEDIPDKVEGFAEVRHTHDRKIVKFTEYIDKRRVWTRSIFGNSWFNEWTLDKDGGNADTVGGYRANDFAKTEYFNSAGDFTFMQAKYKDNWYRLQLRHSGEVQVWKSTNAGVNWALVQRLDKDFLPLTGGTITGNDLFLGNGYGRWMSDSKCIQLVSINEPNGNNARWLEVKNSNFDANVKTAFQFREMINGNITDYIALHTGNSLKVQASNDAPTDANTMWYDTANKTWKRYVDGAWTVA